MVAQDVVTIIAVLLAIWLVCIIAKPAAAAAVNVIPSLITLAIVIPFILSLLRKIQVSAEPFRSKPRAYPHYRPAYC